MLTLELDVNTNMMLALREHAKMEQLVSIMEDQIMNAFVHLDMLAKTVKKISTIVQEIVHQQPLVLI